MLSVLVALTLAVSAGPQEVFIDLASGPPPVLAVEPGPAGLQVRLRHASPRGAYRATIDWSSSPPTRFDVPGAGQSIASFRLPSECAKLLAEALLVLESQTEAEVAAAILGLQASAASASSCAQRDFLLAAVDREVNRHTRRSFTAAGGEQFVVVVERMDPASPERPLRSWNTRVMVRDPDAHWPVPNEEAWLVQQTARYVIDLALSAARRPVPAELDVDVVRETTPGTLRYRIVASAGAKVTQLLVLEPYVWSPVAWAVLARQVLGQAHASAGSAATDDQTLKDLLDLQATVIAAAAARISKRLSAAPGDPSAHEQAALVLAAFALRENSGPFSELRPTLSRLAAHLAVARALREERGRAGRYAEIALAVLAGRQKEASESLEAIRAGASPTEQAWSRALAIRNTEDWRLLRKPAGASLLERLELFRAITWTTSASRAVEVVGPQLEPIPDWSRIVIGRGRSVQEGHAFVSSAGQLELQEARSLYAATHAGPLPPERYVEALNESPGRIVGPGREVRVLGWPDWARFLRRHLLSAVDSNSDLLIQGLSWVQEGDAFHSEAERHIGGLEGFSFVRRRAEERLRTAENEVDRDWPAFCAEAARLAGTHPERLSSLLWREAYGRCEHTAGRVANLGPWFTPRIPHGTAFDAPARFYYIHGAPEAREQLEAALEVAPRSEGLVLASLRSVIVNLEPSVAARLVEPLLHYKPSVVQAYVEYLKGRSGAEAETLQAAMRLCDLEIGHCTVMGQAFEESGDVEAAAGAYGRYFQGSRDKVAASWYATWLVDYYLDRSRPEEAMQVAAEAAATGSAAGYAALARVAERSGKLEEAERLFGRILERYDNDGPLLAFYIRQDQLGVRRFAEPARRALSVVFPEGLKRTSLSEFAGDSGGGALIQGESAELKEAGLAPGDIIVAVDGVRVRNLEQFQCARGFSADPKLEIIAFRSNERRFIEASVRTRQPARRLGATLVEGGSPRSVGPEPTFRGRNAPFWAQAMTDPASPDHAQAHDALVELGPSAIPELIKLIEGGDAATQQRALQSLSSSGLGLARLPETSIEAVVRALKTGSPTVRRAAVPVVGVLAHFDPGKAELLGEALGDADDQVRRAVLEQLASILPAASAAHAMPAVSRLLKNGTEGQRGWLLENLTRLRLDTAAATATVVLELASGGPVATRRAALLAAVYAARGQPALAEVVGKALVDPAAEVRRTALNAVQALGSAAEALVPVLERMAREDPDQFIRNHADVVLRQVRKQ